MFFFFSSLSPYFIVIPPFTKHPSSELVSLNTIVPGQNEFEEFKDNYYGKIDINIAKKMMSTYPIYVPMFDCKITDSKSQDFLQIIRNSGHFLLNLINDILDLSKIEAGKLKLEKSVMNLLEICREMSGSTE